MKEAESQMDVLVTGGTGHLGTDLVELLVARGDRVRVLARAPGRRQDVEWIRGDLATGSGIAAAVRGIDTVIHAATHSPAAQRGRLRLGDFLGSPADVDVDGTRRLLSAAADAGVGHFCHVSIVGVQQARVPYPRRKAEAEHLVRSGTVPWSIVPATGFYWLLARMLDVRAEHRFWVLPSNLHMQPCDSGEFAGYLAECVADGPRGDRPGFGGPQILTVAELGRCYQQSRGIHRPIVSLRLPGFAVRATGPQTCPDGRRGELSWAEWLAGRRMASR
jgi:uncharacterized protein YbjT (DUF2867 family)